MAKEASQQLVRAQQDACKHGHSITGPLEMVKRLLPEFTGAEPQPGYMLDVCKVCLKALQERPYDARSTRIQMRPTGSH